MNLLEILNKSNGVCRSSGGSPTSAHRLSEGLVLNINQTTVKGGGSSPASVLTASVATLLMDNVKIILGPATLELLVRFFFFFLFILNTVNQLLYTLRPAKVVTRRHDYGLKPTNGEKTNGGIPGMFSLHSTPILLLGFQTRGDD